MNFENIKNLREELELTQSEMAKLLGCTRSTYSLWELNINVIPIYYLNKIANTFNVDIDYLVGLSKVKLSKFKKNEIDNIVLGKNIKIARKSINYTQEQLAQKLNTTHSVISAYESGKTNVSTLFLIEIAKITKKSLTWLLEFRTISKSSLLKKSLNLLIIMSIFLPNFEFESQSKGKELVCRLFLRNINEVSQFSPIPKIKSKLFFISYLS